jgi:hypothetical protein
MIATNVRAVLYADSIRLFVSFEEVKIDIWPFFPQKFNILTIAQT